MACTLVGVGWDGDAVAGFGVTVHFGLGGARYECMLRVRGCRSFFSLMVMTIFSRSSGVMWRSRPRLRLLHESCLRM